MNAHKKSLHSITRSFLMATLFVASVCGAAFFPASSARAQTVLPPDFVGPPGPGQVLSPSGPFVPTYDGANHIVNTITSGNTSWLVKKELDDGLFNMAAKLVIQNITDSIVSWINSGFQGNPAFISNPDEFFTDVADQVAGNYIAGLVASSTLTGPVPLDFLCSPFRLEIAGALNFNHSSSRRIVCRLSDVINNVEGFTKFTRGDFNQGGWDGWFSMTQNPSNNPYGAYAQAESELSLRISGAQGRELTLSNWSRGFLSFRDANGNIQTPGSIIETQLSNVLGSGVRQLELADEFNEIVGALMGQLVQQVLIGGLSSARSVKDNTYSAATEGSCAADRNTARVGENVVWRAYRYEPGVTNYSYTWEGSAPLAGQTGSSVTVQYATSSLKTGRVRISGGSGLTTVNCTGSVNVTP